MQSQKYQFLDKAHMSISSIQFSGRTLDNYKNLQHISVVMVMSVYNNTVVSVHKSISCSQMLDQVFGQHPIQLYILSYPVMFVDNSMAGPERMTKSNIYFLGR